MHAVRQLAEARRSWWWAASSSFAASRFLSVEPAGNPLLGTRAAIFREEDPTSSSGGPRLPTPGRGRQGQCGYRAPGPVDGTTGRRVGE